MRVTPILFCAAATLLGAAAPSPEAAWRAGIAEENKDYAQIPHAMLKIQDSAYLGEGQIAVLVGVKGRAASWRWSHDLAANGPLRVGVLRGVLHVAKDGKPVDPQLIAKDKGIAIDAGVDVAGQPTQVGAGINGWRIFIYNQKNPAALNFKGVSYYPYDPAFRVSARFAADAKLPARVFLTSRGTRKQFFHAGDAHFTLAGKVVSLAFFVDDAKQPSDMSAFYTDELSGAGAYAAGRYVDAEGFGKFPPQTVTIDFNNAYNPNCARSAHFTCPLAVDHIAVAMRAGERDPHPH